MRESKIHIYDETSPASRTDPQWVPHTRLLCGREFHLGSDFLAVRAKVNVVGTVLCKKCKKVSEKEKS